ncbi:site-specific integrase [Methylocystis sp. H62]|uniref:tyrosine-type recombinase/integrase n=1 Tax=Methylocystis sp. H62 TaxID=2785789 RepID=UPI0018C20162|nr:site-specific integrase [Methylocystis sp. H62]MBG0794728.1 site-specific integrase [Methylocystis sp. H62]
MKRHHENERMKRNYLAFLKDAKGRDEASIDAVAQSLDEFDAYSRYRDFRRFHIEQARGYKARLLDAKNERTGRPLAAATIKSRLSHLKAFFEWLAQEPGYRRSVKAADAAYFNPAEKLARVASARRFKPFPTLAQVEMVLRSLPAVTEIEMRDRALIAFTILTGARDGAIVTLRLKHVDVSAALVHQDGRDVDTKLSKSFTSWFFPLDEFIEGIVVEWIAFLRKRGFGPSDPIFPKTRVIADPESGFRVAGLDRAPWANAGPMRAIFKRSFEAVSLPYFHPHLFRKTIMQVAYDRKLDLEALKAWSQNLGHEDIVTTVSSYGTISPERQRELVRNRLSAAEIGGDLKRLLQLALAKVDGPPQSA